MYLNFLQAFIYGWAVPGNTFHQVEADLLVHAHLHMLIIPEDIFNGFQAFATPKSGQGNMGRKILIGNFQAGLQDNRCALFAELLKDLGRVIDSKPENTWGFSFVIRKETDFSEINAKRGFWPLLLRNILLQFLQDGQFEIAKKEEGDMKVIRWNPADLCRSELGSFLETGL